MTKKRKKKLRAEDPTKALRRAMKKLDQDQGTVARRNARREVFAELRRLRAFVDKEFPSLSKGTSKRKKRRQGKELCDKLLREGWVDVGPTPAVLLAQCADAGIRVRHVKWWEAASGKPAESRQMARKVEVTLVPQWVLELEDHPDFSVSMLRRARRSVHFRKMALMEAVFAQDERARQAEH